jgi:phage tail sheath gpL-like
MGNMLTSTGSATPDTTVYGPDTAVQLVTEQDCINLFGTGSELHRMFRRFTKVNKSTTVRAIAVSESAGAQATGTITFVGTATAAGTARIFVGDEYADVAIANLDTSSTAATNAATAINTKTHWGVTATATATGVWGYLRITARQKGTRGNEIRYMPQITPAIGMTIPTAVDQAMAGGTTADDNTTALATINTSKYYYIASAAGDATQFGALVTQIGTNAAPTVGIRQRAIAGSVDTISNTNTIATGRNSARADLVWMKWSPWTGGELAANLAAVITAFETKPNPRTNFCGFGNDALTAPYWLVPRPRLDSAIPSRSQVQSALLNGVTPIGINPNGSTYLVDLITTRSLNGSVNDYRIADHHKVTICDFFGEDLLAKTILNHPGMRIMDDAPDGSPQPGDQVVTPKRYRSTVFGLIDTYAGNDLLQDVQLIKDGTQIQREQSPRTRLACRIPLRPCDNAKQFAILVQQVSAFALGVGLAAYGVLQHLA